MDGYTFLNLRKRPDLTEQAAEWFHEKWGIPAAAYRACMEDYVNLRTEYGWYLCLEGEAIAAGLGVIENDFHPRRDLAPNICAVYTEPHCRRRGLARRLLSLAVEELRRAGLCPVYLLTDHTGFYERCGWEFFCMVQGERDAAPSRMYIHRCAPDAIY